jgi:hypothetical protein
LKLLVEKARVRKSSKKDITEEDTQMPTYNDGKHRPIMPRRKFEANLENFGKIYDPIKQR